MVHGQMLGPTLAPEQQEALMHILVALQQSGDAVPQQDLDVAQVSRPDDCDSLSACG